MTTASTKPSFIGIGAQKCASTWLYDILSDHPEACVSEVKEVNFFSYHFDHGYEWYERHLGTCDGVKARGEISPSYFYEPAVPERIFDYAPDAKLLVSLRDPVDRAISNHKHEVRVGHLSGDDLSFERGLHNNPTYIEQGLYAKQLKRWLAFFPADRILVVLFEDVLADPEAVAKRVYRFLDIDQNHRSAALDTRSNVGHLNRSPRVHEARRRVRLALSAIGLGAAWERIADLGFRKVYRRYNWVSADTKIPAVSAQTRAMLRARFRDDILELQTLIGRPLNKWLAEERVDVPDAEPSGADDVLLAQQ
ncbi:MAG: sulfotransferase domain-containing protein [Thiohalocapsa sp.]|nr:sulfotransferase domain-containing protein [Thiohalocapsa sp.]